MQLGLVLSKLGKPKEALERYKTALAIIEQYFYPAHGKLALILESMADVFVSRINLPRRSRFITSIGNI